MGEALVSHLYKEATPEESRAVQAHLVSCASCREELAGFEQVRGMLQHWQVEQTPAIRVATPSARPSALALIRELLSMTPLWGKAVGALAMAMLVFAVLGTDVKIGSGGFTMRTDLFRRNPPAAPPQMAVAPGQTGGQLSGPQVENLRAELISLVNTAIVDNERQQKDEIKMQLVSFEFQLKNMRATDLTRLSARIQEHQARLKTIEQDIDRREGSDLSDILYGENSSERRERIKANVNSGE